MATPVFQCFGGAVSNPQGDGIGYPCILYNPQSRPVLSLQPDQIRTGLSFDADLLTLSNGPLVRRYRFGKSFRCNPGDVFVLDLSQNPKAGSVFRGTQFQFEVALVPLNNEDSAKEAAASTVHQDTYLEKVLALAHLHVLLGSTREDFARALTTSGIKDTVALEPLTKDQFEEVNKANATVRLEGSATEDVDQQLYDESAMLATFVNTRINAINNLTNPKVYDISSSEAQLEVINISANGLFNYYFSRMGTYVTSLSPSTETVKQSLQSADVKAEALKAIFVSLALPESAIAELVGAATAFVDSVQTLAVKSKRDDLHTAKLVNFYSVQPPPGAPTLAHVCKMRMIYVQFVSRAVEWSAPCASGMSYNLDTIIWNLDVELNRKIVHLIYPTLTAKILEAALIDIDDLGSAGADPTTKPVKVPGPSPVGPLPPTLTESSHMICP